MNKHAEYTQDRLETIRRTRARLRAAGLILNLGAVLLVALLTVALIDYWALLPAALRMMGATGLAAGAGFGLFNLVRWWRRPVSLKQIALEVESRRPELGCLLSTAAEHLDARGGDRNDFGPELIAALHEQSARRLLQVETDWYQREFRRAAGGFGVAALGLVLFLFLAPAAKLALLRTLTPWQNVAYTSVEVEPGNIELPRGENQPIAAAFAGRLPRDPQLEWRRESDRGWQVIAMLPDQGNQFLQVLEKISEDLVYRVRGAQAVSPEYQIATYVPPGLEGVAVQVEYPEYTGLAPRRLDEASFSVVRGSRLEWRVATAGDVAQARMRFASLPGFELKPVGTNEWTAGFTPKQDLHYWIDLLDRKQRRGGSRQPHQVAVVPDEKPKAAIQEPGADIRANPLDIVPLAIEVADDFGIAHVQLVVRKMDGTTKTFPLELKDGGTKTAKLETIIDLAPFKLKPYELLSYHVEVRDNNTLDGPGTGRSPVYFIEYTSREKALSQCQGGNSQSVNLLVLQKHIIASTLAIPEERPAGKFADIAGVQRQTKKYAEVFRNAFQLQIAPKEAREEFDAALRAMDGSVEHLETLSRELALQQQEQALQHLYEVARLLPECEKGFCEGGGNCFKIYLEAIEKLKQETRQEREQSLKAALAQAKELERRQRELVNLYRNELKDVPPGDGTAKEGEPKDGKGGLSGGKPGPNGGRGSTGDQGKAGELAALQEKLAGQAAELKRLLEQLSGRDARVSSRYGEMFGQAARRLQAASGGVGAGDFRIAEREGQGGISVISEAIHLLEHIYDESTVVADLATEEYPKAFEAKINAYLKTLSYAE